MPPFFYRGAGDDGVLRFFDELGRRTRIGPDFLHLYNFPAMSGTTFGHDLVRRIHDIVPPAGLKDSSNDLAYCAGLHIQFPHLQIFPSSETHLRFAKNAGFAGCISGTAALWVSEASDLWHTAHLASSAPQQREIAARREAVAAHPLIPAVRFLTSLQQHDTTWETPIPPLQPLGADARHTLR